MIKVKVINKSRNAAKVHVKTRADTATENEDYEGIDEVIEFKKGQSEVEVSIKIYDDDEWEPDEDFYVDLYDAETKAKLIGGDTTTRITIIDDDKPGDLVFQEKRGLKHAANESICRVLVQRIHGCDGTIKCDYRTVELDGSERTAISEVDFTPVNGTLEFAHGEVEKLIEIPIIQKKDADNNDVERDELFALKLSNPVPSIVKISKKDTLMIEIVSDAEKKKQSDSLQ